MHRAAALLLSGLILLASATAAAWDGAGHMVTAAVAYRQLSASEKAKVDAILAHHPEADRWDADRAHYDPSLDLGEYRFLRAAKWPDEIKRKKGWPNRSSWHYANTAVTSPTSPMGDDPGADHNIVVGLRESEETVRDAGASAEDRAVALAFIIHLIGDLHQPLHLATAVTAEHPAPKGDEGGNETKIRIEDRRTVKLHEVWDDLLGKSKDPEDADHQAIELLHRIPASTVAAGGTESDWANESWRLAQTVAYPAGTWSRQDDEPIPVDRAYIEKAKSTGERQMIVGGVRLAVVIRRTMDGGTVSVPGKQATPETSAPISAEWPERTTVSHRGGRPQTSQSGCACGSRASRPDVAVLAVLTFILVAARKLRQRKPKSNNRKARRP